MDVGEDQVVVLPADADQHALLQLPGAVLSQRADGACIEGDLATPRGGLRGGHFGTGDLEIRISTPADLEKAKPLLQASYEAS